MAKSKAKPPTAKPSPSAAASRGGGKSSGKSAGEIIELLRPLLRPTLGLLGFYLIFGLILPALADLTPPGVDPKMVAAWAEEQYAGAQAGCENACRGMGCPAGWTTARAPDDHCRCICARIDPTNRDTPWDAERQQKEVKEVAAQVEGKMEQLPQLQQQASPEQMSEQQQQQHSQQAVAGARPHHEEATVKEFKAHTERGATPAGEPVAEAAEAAEDVVDL